MSENSTGIKLLKLYEILQSRQKIYNAEKAF